ncbi:RidA family protein [Alpinimonas psychrophila]|uniref:Reactive intermediate/imine deaminase n=1 Tax=Alpinimonas psychrophila TaxID=748908 RepID=A0A7W3JTL8_9MICO|nr:Rid family hydrolase [Alpinimonas psychrophila]MBA8829034.1 reactive intermediate/imine deaminase [Alpinimonas psychrophila]
MIKKAVTTLAAPPPTGAYSQGIAGNGFFYTAGFGPQDPLTGALATSVGEQTRQVLRNIEAVLQSAGLTTDDVVKATVHLQDLERDFEEYNSSYSEFFKEPYPVRTTVGSQLRGILVEIDVVAALPKSR